MYEIERMPRNQYEVGNKCVVHFLCRELNNSKIEVPVTITKLSLPDHEGLREVSFLVGRTLGTFSALHHRELSGFCQGDMENWKMANIGETTETLRGQYELATTS